MSAFAFRPIEERQIHLPLGKWRIPLWKLRDPLIEFRNMCHEMGEGPVVLPPDIVMMGADYDLDPPTLHQRDKAWLRYTLGECRELGLRVRPDFNLFALNLKYKQDGLAPGFQVKGGIFIVPFVIDPSTNFGKAQLAMGVLDLEGQISPYHSPQAWRQLVENSGAKVIVTISQRLENGEIGEISAKYFEGPDYIAMPPHGLRFSGLNGADLLSTDISDCIYIAEMLVHRDAAAESRLNRNGSLTALSA